jgi:hypothetical protein
MTLPPTLFKVHVLLKIFPTSRWRANPKKASRAKNFKQITSNQAQRYRKDGGGGAALFSLASKWARLPRQSEQMARGGASMGGRILRLRERIQCPRIWIR